MVVYLTTLVGLRISDFGLNCSGLYCTLVFGLLGSDFVLFILGFMIY